MASFDANRILGEIQGIAGKAYIYAKINGFYGWYLLQPVETPEELREPATLEITEISDAGRELMQFHQHSDCGQCGKEAVYVNAAGICRSCDSEVAQ